MEGGCVYMDPWCLCAYVCACVCVCLTGVCRVDGMNGEVCVVEGGGGSVLCKLCELGSGACPCIFNHKRHTCCRSCLLFLLMVPCVALTQEDNFDVLGSAACPCISTGNLLILCIVSLLMVLLCHTQEDEFDELGLPETC